MDASVIEYIFRILIIFGAILLGRLIGYISNYYHSKITLKIDDTSNEEKDIWQFVIDEDFDPKPYKMIHVRVQKADLSQK